MNRPSLRKCLGWLFGSPALSPLPLTTSFQQYEWATEWMNGPVQCNELLHLYSSILKNKILFPCFGPAIELVLRVAFDVTPPLPSFFPSSLQFELPFYTLNSFILWVNSTSFQCLIGSVLRYCVTGFVFAREFTSFLGVTYVCSKCTLS